MTDLGKILVVTGIGLALIGGIVLLLGKSGVRGMPGDAYRGEHLSFYFPVVTCIVVSILLTTLVWLWRWLSGR